VHATNDFTICIWDEGAVNLIDFSEHNIREIVTIKGLEINLYSLNKLSGQMKIYQILT